MADKNDKRVRDENNPGRVDKNTRSSITSTDDDIALAPSGDEGDIIPPVVDKEDGDTDVLTEEELRELRYQDIDDTEIDDTNKTSALYRRAAEDFDPKETEVQLAEHFVYTDAELEEFGYF